MTDREPTSSSKMRRSSERLEPTSAREPSCCRQIELGRFLVGEVDAMERARIGVHLEGCADCRARLEALEEQEKRFARENDVASESARILERLEKAESLGESRVRAWLAALWARPSRLIAAAAAAVLLCVLPASLLLRSTLGPGSSPTNRVKGGGVGLEMFVNDPKAGARPASDGITLHAGDQIQFRYRAGGRKYVFVVSVGDGGGVSPLYPNDPTRSIEVTPTGTHVLDGSIILDEARGPERILALFSDRPLSYSEVKAALDRTLAKERDVTRLRGVHLEREDVDEATVLIHKE